MRYWITEVEVNCFPITENVKSVHKTKGKEEFDADAHAGDYYGGMEQNENGNYLLNDGEAIISDCGCKEISKKDYDVLKKYI
jgi:hypothetical protein